jgi:hypothetical protein
MSIVGNMAGCYSPMGKTFIITDENGNELTGVITDQEQIFTATDNDVREGFVYASDAGISTGTKDIPSYYTRCGHKFVLAGKQVTLTAPEYNYKNLMITISTYDTSVDKSVVPTHISVGNEIYAVGNSTKLSDITVDADNGLIDFGITVNEKSVLRYCITKEEY